jgi:heavy metal sensor kinase
MNRLPIRVRVTAAFALAMAAVLAASGWFLYARLDSHLSRALDHELQVRAQDVASLVRQPGATLAGNRGSRLVERGESFAQLTDAKGHVLDATRPLAAAPLLSAAELRAAVHHPIYTDRRTVPGLDEPSRLLATSVTRAGRNLILVVGATRGDSSETLAAFRHELLLAGPIALVLASLAGYLLAGLSLRQVESMRRRAAAISADTPGRRLPVPPTGDELERLAKTLNEMLERLEAALDRERDFVADAGHELRTPLALLRTELELAARHGATAAELREAVQASSQEVERLAQLAEGLLLIARSDGGKLALNVETLDLADVSNAVATRFEWRAAAEQRMLVADVEAGTEVRGDRLRLEQALSNIVDNALRHGECDVRLALVSSNGAIELHVSDEGPGFPARFLEHAFERFTRAERARGGPGAGLGLAIAQAIAEAHGGQVRAANGRNGGADVWLGLPPPSSRDALVTSARTDRTPVGASSPRPRERRQSELG